MTKKIAFLLILFITFCFAEHSWAYEAAVLRSADIELYNKALEGFQSACNCSITTLDVNGIDKARVPDAIYRLRPDVVLAIGIDALAGVRKIKDIPVVYVMVPGPLSTGPDEGNISGVSMNISPSKYLDAMSKLFPGAGRVGLVYDPKSSGSYVKDAIKSAAAMGMKIIARKAGTASAVPSLIQGLKEKIDIFWMLPEVNLLNAATLDYMLLFSFENRVPIFTFSKKYVDMGAAAALTVDPFAMGAQAGAIAKKLRAAGAAGKIRLDANVSEIVINGKVLQKFGIKLSDKIMQEVKDAD